MSNYVQGVRIALHEQGVDYEFETFTGPEDFQTEEHGIRHPFRKIPAFQHGDLNLFETIAILSYISDTFDATPLFPDDAAGRARTLQWMSAASDYLYTSVMRGYVIPVYFAPMRGIEPDWDVINAGIPDIRHILGIYEDALGERDHMVDDMFTAADIMTFPMLMALSRVGDGGDILADFGNLKRGMASFFARKSVKKAYAK